VPTETTIAETLPRVYRRVLDATDRLQELGARAEAAAFRASAIRVYSGPWDAASHRRLQEVLARIETTTRTRERRDRLRAG